MKIAAIVNPYAGRGRTKRIAEHIHNEANALGLPLALHWTRHAHDGMTLAEELARSNDLICVIGGDGTFHEVINGLMPRPKPVVLVPAGSGNDFAKLVPCPRDARELVTVVNTGMGVKTDVIGTGIRYCVNSIGLGFEALVTHHSRSIRRLRGIPLYMTAVFKALVSFRNSNYTVSLGDEEPVTGERLLISVGNGVSAGGGFYLTPDACPDDGKLDLCIISPMRRLRMLHLLPMVLKGRHVNKRGVAMHSCGNMTIESDSPCHLHIDGEYLGEKAWKLDISIHPCVLPVLCMTDGNRKTRREMSKIL